MRNKLFLIINLKNVNVSFTLMFLLITTFGFAQSKLTFSSGLQFLGNNFSDGNNHISTYFYNGLRYDEPDYSISFSIPIVFTGNGSFNQVGNMMLPANASSSNANKSSFMHGGSMNTNMSSINIGLGDFYLFGSYYLAKQNSRIPGIAFDIYAKFPTATSSLNLGTGKFDYSFAVSLKENFGSVLVYSQIGYLILGDSDSLNYSNPITLSIGLGSNFNTLNHALYLNYESYSSILNGTSSPEQISLGYNYIANKDLSYVFILSYGLNSSASDLSLSGGINLGIL